MVRPPSEAARLAAEFLGTALLLAAVVGSGIAVSFDGAASAQLFQHAVVVGLGLFALILCLGPVSGAHFNPVVTGAAWWLDELPARRAWGYLGAQLTGAVAGTLVTQVSFGLPALDWSGNPRDGWGMLVGEAVATVGLVLVIFALIRTDNLRMVPAAVGAYIAAAICFTASASFANPAVTFARSLTDTFTGIAPHSIPTFLAGQALGLVAAIVLVQWFYPLRARADVVKSMEPEGLGDSRTTRQEAP